MGERRLRRSATRSGLKAVSRSIVCRFWWLYQPLFVELRFPDRFAELHTNAREFATVLSLNTGQRLSDQGIFVLHRARSPFREHRPTLPAQGEGASLRLGNASVSQLHST